MADLKCGRAAFCTRLQEELVPLNMRLEIGEISESELATKEVAVLEKLRAFRGGNEAGGAMA